MTLGEMVLNLAGADLTAQVILFEDKGDLDDEIIEESFLVEIRHGLTDNEGRPAVEFVGRANPVF